MESSMMQPLMMVSTVPHGREKELPALRSTAHAVGDVPSTEITGSSLRSLKMWKLSDDSSN